MDFYKANFAAFVLANSLFTYVNWKRESESPSEQDEKKSDAPKTTLFQFKLRFLPIYLLVNGADWLQGAYIYPIYKDTKGLPEEIVAALFMTGFVSAAVSASFTGVLADRYGRRMACQAFCIIYSLSCCTLLSNDIFLLFVGRCLGGCSATLMYTVFESWMITDFHRVLPDAPSVALSNIFSIMSTLNSVIAIISGIASEFAANITGSHLAPFALSVCCLILALMGISSSWIENYGDNGGDQDDALKSSLEQQQEPAKSFWQHMKQDPRILSLSLTSGVFEGSMYIFIFFKFPALKYAHALTNSSSGLPFGLIFAILMCSMMLGSIFHTYLINAKLSSEPSKLLCYTIGVASMCFAVPVLVRDEKITFWSFCVFEVCCGMYFPLMAYQRGKIVEDGVRARMYGMMRIPLNVFVVLVLASTKEGLAHRDLVFTICSGLLLIAGVINSTVIT